MIATAMSEHGQALATKGDWTLIARPTGCAVSEPGRCESGLADGLCGRRCRDGLFSAGASAPRAGGVAAPGWRARGACLGQRADAFSPHPVLKARAGVAVAVSRPARLAADGGLVV